MKKAKCSLKVVKEDGTVLHGTAAILHATTRDGGYDEHMRKYGEKVLTQVFQDHVLQERKPRLRRVK
ncbi:hypothetical protein ACSPNK_003670 [Providencia stuartii]|uniref:hypothetical protein n=1 Tax=Providencia stuartii TaxID=588 RepID=UPI0013D0BB11|nr:hypothetical protein [Providencia stuartii]